jgi:superfamily I DNA and RNA helicase
VKILVEIYDDGKDPITCARDWSKKSVCQFLRTGGFRTKGTSCDLFHKDLKRRDCSVLGKESGFLMPCKECLAARKNKGNQ